MLHFACRIPFSNCCGFAEGVTSVMQSLDAESQFCPRWFPLWIGQAFLESGRLDIPQRIWYRPAQFWLQSRGVTFGMVCCLDLWRLCAFTRKQIDRGTTQDATRWRINSL
jgi:hypothetical protein